MRSARRCFALFVLAAAALVACSTTEMVGQWTDPQYLGRPVASMLVIARVPDEPLRRTFEDRLVATLQERGVNATASYRVLPDLAAIDDGLLRDRIRNLGLEGVLVTELLDQEQVVIGHPYYRPYGPYRPYGSAFASPFYGSYRGAWPYDDWHGYYGAAPPYTESMTYATAFLMESRLHRGEDAALVWSARTKTTTQERLDSKVEEVVRQVVEGMERNGMI